MNYDLLIILAIILLIVVFCLKSKLNAAKMIAETKMSDSKAESIAKMFTFDPLSFLNKK